MSIQISFTGGPPGDWLLPLLCIYGLVWLLCAGSLLQRPDLEPVTKLTWVVVMIFVPFFGLLLYWAVAPRSTQTKIDSSDQLSGTPWADDSGYTAKGK